MAEISTDSNLSVVENTTNKVQSQNRLPHLKNTGRTHFKAGISGNPGGRPKGLMQWVREQTKDGKELVRIMLEIARGQLVIEETYLDSKGKEKTLEKAPRHQDRISAIEWLADRGFGKAVTQIEVTGKDGGQIEFKNVDDLKRDLISMGALDSEGKVRRLN